MSSMIRTTFKRIPLAFKSMLSLVPFGVAYYSYATYLESEKINSAEISRLAAYDRDRNIIGEDKIKNALAGTEC